MIKNKRFFSERLYYLASLWIPVAVTLPLYWTSATKPSYSNERGELLHMAVQQTAQMIPMFSFMVIPHYVVWILLTYLIFYTHDVRYLKRWIAFMPLSFPVVILLLLTTMPLFIFFLPGSLLFFWGLFLLPKTTIPMVLITCGAYVVVILGLGYFLKKLGCFTLRVDTPATGAM